MKLVKLTGRATGFAPVLISALEQNGYRVQGYGVGDINLNDAVEVAKTLSDADVFINNANYKFSQTELLYELFQLWKNDSNKHIINISSRAAQPNISKGYLYAAQKAALEHLSNNLTFNSYKKCKISTISIGLMRNEGKYAITYSDVAKTVIDVIQYKHEIPNITVQHEASYLEVQEWKQQRI